MRWLIRYDGLACHYYIKAIGKRKQNIHAIESAER